MQQESTGLQSAPILDPKDDTTGALHAEDHTDNQGHQSEVEEAAWVVQSSEVTSHVTEQRQCKWVNLSYKSQWGWRDGSVVRALAALERS